MIKEPKKQKMKFQRQYELFKDNHMPDYELKDIFEIHLPFWYCRQSVVVEKNVEVDRFSKIILQTIQLGLMKHSEICEFLGVDANSFITSQFHFLIKNGLIDETLRSNDSEYKITFDGVSFLERKKKIVSVETVGFEYFYNDLTHELVEISQSFDLQNNSASKNRKFSQYQVLQSNLLGDNVIQIPHKNRPHKLKKVEFANFFNQQNKTVSFYDFEHTDKVMHKRSICFLAFEYEDKTGLKVYDIRHSKKSVKTFHKNEIEKKLSKKVTEYLKKNPLKKEMLRL
jgi:predicted transcriptional regulator